MLRWARHRLFLDVAFHLRKAGSYPWNDAFYAIQAYQIKVLRRSTRTPQADHHVGIPNAVCLNVSYVLE